MTRGKRPSNSDSVLRAAWEYQRDIEELYGVRVRIDLVMVRFRRGIYDIYIQAWPMGDEETSHAPWSYARNYPNETNESLAGCLLVSLIKFEQQLADAHGYSGTKPKPRRM